MTNLRRVNRSVARLESQNKNFLGKIVSFRKGRLNEGREPSIGRQNRLISSPHSAERS